MNNNTETNTAATGAAPQGGATAGTQFDDLATEILRRMRPSEAESIRLKQNDYSHQTEPALRHAVRLTVRTPWFLTWTPKAREARYDLASAVYTVIEELRGKDDRMQEPTEMWLKDELRRALSNDYIDVNKH